MSKIKITYGKKYDSIALITDGVHSKIDVLSSLGVLLGLVIIQYWHYMDALLAIIIGIYLLKESINLAKEINSSLIGKSADDQQEEKIRTIIKQQNIDLANLKTQKLGSILFAEITIKVDSKLSVKSAEKITKKLKNNLEKNIPELKYIVIQIKSLNIKESFYRNNNITKTIEWKGKYGEKKAGPFGMCICPKCNYKIKHKRGFPCKMIKCPECGTRMERE